MIQRYNEGFETCEHDRHFDRHLQRDRSEPLASAGIVGGTQWTRRHTKLRAAQSDGVFSALLAHGLMPDQRHRGGPLASAVLITVASPWLMYPSLLATPEGLIEGKLLRAAFCESFVLDQRPFSSSTGADKVSGGW
jgi:hypothetical protein